MFFLSIIINSLLYYRFRKYSLINSINLDRFRDIQTETTRTTRSTGYNFQHSSHVAPIQLNNPAESLPHEKRITKMVLNLCFVFSISRLFQSICTITIIYEIKNGKATYDYFVLIFSFIAYLITYLSFGVSLFIYIRYNRGFKLCLKRLINRFFLFHLNLNKNLNSRITYT